MFKVGIIVLSCLVLSTKSARHGPSAPNKDAVSNNGNADENIDTTGRPPVLFFDATTESPNEMTRSGGKDKKEKVKVDDADLKLKLSSLIDKDEKIKNKEYKDQFISYVLSFEDKKEDYNDNIKNGNDDKIKKKYELYVESDLYINSLNENLDIKIYEHTQFSDWSLDEKKAILIPDEEYESRRRLALQSCYSFAGWGSGSSISVDFRANAQAIKNQGGCGSCWAFASAGQYELNYYLYKGVKQSQSEQFILDCVGDSIGNCGGGWPTDTNRWLGTYGSCPTSSYWSYDGKDTWSCDACWGTKTPTSYTACLTQSSTGYAGTSQGFWNIVANTAQYVGLSYWMSISNNFYYLSSTYPYLYSCDSSNILGAHAMSIYGEWYNDWLLVRNQWGTGFGMSGYFWLNTLSKTSCNFRPDVSFNYW
jgi:C1A family cysteine protease